MTISVFILYEKLTFKNISGCICAVLRICCITGFLQLWQLEDNPYSYNSHVEIVKLWRKQGDLNQLRRAREHMSAIFPLTEGVFL